MVRTESRMDMLARMRVDDEAIGWTRFANAAPAWPRGWRVAFAASAVLTVALALAGRLTGASDLHDQTQEKTIAYTTNIVLHADEWDRWVLPLHNGAFPATKPPLYNWLAAPGVWLTDGRSEIAHRLPSVLAFLALAATVWRVGRRIDPQGVTGPIAAIVLASHYAWFKLSALARPDTVLSFWLVLGWVGVTLLHASPRLSAGRRRAWRVVVWTSAGLAVLAKGPAAVLIPLYAATLGWCAPRRSPIVPASDAAVAPAVDWRERLVGARDSLRATGAWWGTALIFVLAGTWFAAVWRIDPAHVRTTLIHEEIVGRVLGTGSEGTREGPWDFVRTGLNMPLYFLTRFAPWSIFFLAALWDIFQSARSGLARSLPDGWDERSPRLWVFGAIVFTLLVIAVFSLSSGKRADYIASAHVTASLVVAWSLTHLGLRPAWQFPSWVMALGLAMVASLITHDRALGYAARFPLTEALREFTVEARAIVESPPHGEATAWPVEFYRAGANPLQALMHRSQPDLGGRLRERLEAVESGLWLVAQPRVLDSLLAEQEWTRNWSFEPVLRSRPVRPSEDAHPYEAALYRVTLR